MENEINEIFCYESMFPEPNRTDEDPLMAFKATADPDVMYMH